MTKKNGFRKSVYAAQLMLEELTNTLEMTVKLGANAQIH